MNTTYCNMPMCECPHCGHEFQWEDYYEVEHGSSRECPRCEETIHVRCVDSVMMVELATEADD